MAPPDGKKPKEEEEETQEEGPLSYRRNRLHTAITCNNVCS